MTGAFSWMHQTEPKPRSIAEFTLEPDQPTDKDLLSNQVVPRFPEISGQQEERQ